MNLYPEDFAVEAVDFDEGWGYGWVRCLLCGLPFTVGPDTASEVGLRVSKILHACEDHVNNHHLHGEMRIT